MDVVILVAMLFTFSLISFLLTAIMTMKAVMLYRTVARILSSSSSSRRRSISHSPLKSLFINSFRSHLVKVELRPNYLISFISQINFLKIDLEIYFIKCFVVIKLLVINKIDELSLFIKLNILSG